MLGAALWIVVVENSCYFFMIGISTVLQCYNVT